MRAANRQLVVLAYMNALFAQTEDGARYPDAWYARDASGRRVRNANTGNWMMLPTSEGWVDDRIAECRRRTAEGGYDGCTLDMLGLASLSLGYVTGRPVNPATGREFTREQWLAANARLAARVSAATSGLVYGNGLSTGSLYFGGNTRSLVANLDGGVAEAWLRGSKTGVKAFPSVQRWLQDVRMVQDMQQRGKPLLTLTKLWVDATAKQRDRWRRFALASYLLATDGTSYFFFSGGHGASRTAEHPWYRTRLGRPTSGMLRRSGVYVRNFRAGKVLVNPFETPRRVRFTRRYINLSGRRIPSAITMAPHSAQILRRAG
jgi:hypothetical protein